MAALDRIATAQNNQFAARVAMILMKLAIGVMNEQINKPNHANRLKLAQLHIKAQVNAKSIAAAIIASSPTIQASIDDTPADLGSGVLDSDLEFVLTGLYDGLANAYAAT